jgi:hypothetical protein
MKVLLSILITLVSINSFSYDICAVLPSEYSDGNVTHIYEKSVTSGKSFSSWEQDRIMTFILDIDNSYEDEDGNVLKTFEQVYSYFGASNWDELHLSVMKDNKTGRKYSYVWSYPGDNEVGFYMDDNGKVVGVISDGSLMDANGQWCN